MLTKANFSILNSAYIFSTNARMSSPHPSPTDIYQAILLLSKVKFKSKYLNAQGTVSPTTKAIQALSWLNHTPWSNGNISPLTMHPLISLGKYVYQNSSNIESFLKELQLTMQTRVFFEREENWKASFKTYEQAFDKCFKNIIKNVSGFELQEFTLESSSIQNDSLQFDNLIKLIAEKSSTLIHESEPEKFLAIFLKKEPCLNQRMRVRLIVILQKDFIDDPYGFSDSHFFKSLKHTVESSSCYAIQHEMSCLNGFFRINRFNKKSQDFKEQMKWLKGYLIGTDILYRMNELQSTFQIIYSKFD
ncbi:hypothetical protein [Acinetobacter sp. ANC 5502]